MRGLSKAAVLLSSVYASASVAPRSLSAEPVGVPDYVIKYKLTPLPDESEASVVFQISEPIAPGITIPPLKFRVGSTAEPCGDSNIRLDGQRLPLEWDGGHGLGSDFLDAFKFLPNIFTTWYISCIEDVSRPDSTRSGHREPIQIAQFGIYNHNGGRSEAAGFAVSFRSSQPEILRLVPTWVEYSDIVSSPDVWTTPSLAVKPSSPESEPEDGPRESNDEQHNDNKQKSLKAHIQQVQRFLGTTFEKARQTFKSWCPPSRDKQSILANSKEESSPDSPKQADSTVASAVEPSGTNPHALPTRSASPDPISLASTPNLPSYAIMKIFGLILVLSTLCIWVFLRLRDPRLQADRAARREERRNKRLYRQAATEHKLKKWFCSWRHRGHQCTPVSTSDEKRACVLQQEDILEEAMKKDIRKLRNVHRAENRMDAAERGRSIYMYDSDDSRRRSRETLPGYESDGTQPPSYEHGVAYQHGVDGVVTRLADGFRYIPADREDTPESSVISTSPRTSRDDRDSDFGKDFEPLNLGKTVLAV
ncbi:MAG: hypothetical protein L6R37_000207 [Teloschistes peruensis]|nr:MAG: hypothetical protein L6R37_000207 [Teloschistes peruensis]